MSRRKLFKADHARLTELVDSVAILANEAADQSAEYYRRYQLGGSQKDLELSNLLHDVVNTLKKLEDTTGKGSPIDAVLSQKIAEEPGFWASLFSRSHHEQHGNIQTENAKDFSEVLT